METALTTNPRVPVDPPASDRPSEPGELRAPNTAVAAIAPNSETRVPPALWTRWLNRIAVSLFVLFCTVLGIWLAFKATE